MSTNPDPCRLVGALLAALIALSWGADRTLGPAPAIAQETTPGAGQTAENPSAFISTLTRKSLDLVGGDANTAEIEDLVEANIPVPTLARLMLGRHAEDLSEAQRTAFEEALVDYISGLYARRMRETLVEDVQIGDVEQVNERDSMVSTQVAQVDGPAVNVDWRVREIDGQYKLLDMVIEGVSLLVTKRDEFDALLSEPDGFDRLLEELGAGTEANTG